MSAGRTGRNAWVPCARSGRSFLLCYPEWNTAKACPESSGAEGSLTISSVDCARYSQFHNVLASRDYLLAVVIPSRKDEEGSHKRGCNVRPGLCDQRPLEQSLACPPDDEQCLNHAKPFTNS